MPYQQQPQPAQLTIADLKSQAVKNSLRNGTTEAQEFTKLLKAHPEAYDHYLNVERPAQQEQMRRRGNR